MTNIRYFIPPENIEAEALQQIKNTASMPFVRGLAVMPDVHYGMGSTVGTVVATKGAVMPACVGVDIGCGMIAVETNIPVTLVRDNAQKIREGIERRIPVGIGKFGRNSRLYPSTELRVAQLETAEELYFKDAKYLNQYDKDWQYSVGTLGGGNHFIEICEGHPLAHDPSTPDGFGPHSVWVILHSGSRGIGNRIGTHWTKVAKKQAEKYMYDKWLPDPNLAYLVEHSEEYWEYMACVKWAQEFALLSREEMMDRVLTELIFTLGLEYDPLRSAIGIEVSRVNCHHNFSMMEHHDGEDVLVTRKGAIRAHVGLSALIPGSMGTNSYIVKGLGNPGAYHSAPHGAGRRMSRTKAKAQFDEASLQEAMKGIESRIRPNLVDEHPGAYKDIKETMGYASGLIEATHVLRQIINVKGD